MPPANILLIHADQHRYDCLGITGHPLVQTPSLDRLAREGTLFTHAFTPIPLCTPARCSLMYGTWPSRHGAVLDFGHEVGHPVADDVPAFSQALREAGYWQGYVGKWGVHPSRSPLDFGFDAYVPVSDYGAWRRDQGLPSQPAANGFFGEPDPRVTPAQSRLGWGAARVLDMLEQRASSGQPFLLRWDPPEPHLPNRPPEPYASMYPPEQIPPWPSYPDAFTGKPYIQAQQQRTWGLDRWTWDDWAPVVSRYLGEISLLDAQIGLLLDALDRLGLADNTLVAYTCDHGDLCGGHGLIDKHYVMYDDVVRVPLIVRYPPAGGGRASDAFVAHAIDLAATFQEAAGLPVPETYQGSSLLRLMGGSGNGREDIFSCYFGAQFGLYSQRMVRDRRWKYVWNATAEDELYDLAADPGELCNRAQDADCAGELVRLRGRLLHWLEATGDRLLNGWTRAQLAEGRTR